MLLKRAQQRGGMQSAEYPVCFHAPYALLGTSSTQFVCVADTMLRCEFVCAAAQTARLAVSNVSSVLLVCGVHMLVDIMRTRVS